MHIKNCATDSVISKGSQKKILQNLFIFFYLFYRLDYYVASNFRIIQMKQQISMFNIIFIFILLFVKVLFFPSLNIFSQENANNYVSDKEIWETIAYNSPIVKRRIALSLDRLQKALRHSELSPETPLPITKIKGVIFDESDIILLGVEESNKMVYLVPDDIILAMRSMLIYDEPPGISIDPQKQQEKEDIKRRETSSIKNSDMGPFQNVEYFGLIENTRAGLFAFNCDYWMKQLAAGKITKPFKNFLRYADLIVTQSNYPSGTVKKGSNRFWFYPKASQFVISSDYKIMLLHETGVEVLTEKQHDLFEKKLFRELYSSSKIDPLAKKFTDKFTELYDQLSNVYNDLARLRNFFALCEVFKWAEKRGILLYTWDYLLYKYKPVHIQTPYTADTVRTSFYFDGMSLSLSGGVQGEIRLPASPIEGRKELLKILERAVFSGKSDTDSVFWEYFLPTITTNVDKIQSLTTFLDNGKDVNIYIARTPSGIIQIYNNDNKPVAKASPVDLVDQIGLIINSELNSNTITSATDNILNLVFLYGFTEKEIIGLRQSIHLKMLKETHYLSKINKLNMLNSQKEFNQKETSLKKFISKNPKLENEKVKDILISDPSDTIELSYKKPGNRPGVSFTQFETSFTIKIVGNMSLMSAYTTAKSKPNILKNTFHKLIGNTIKKLKLWKNKILLVRTTTKGVLNDLNSQLKTIEKDENLNFEIYYEASTGRNSLISYKLFEKYCKR